MIASQISPARWLPLAVAIAAALAASSCSTAKPPAAQVRGIEAMLTSAGFHPIYIDTSDQASEAQRLPPFDLRAYDVQAGKVFWYYDPEYCACVYEGDQAAFERYDMLMRQQNDIAEYTDSEDEQVASLNALNYRFFPPPLYWYGYALGTGYGGGGGSGSGGHHHMGGGGHGSGGGSGGSGSGSGHGGGLGGSGHGLGAGHHLGLGHGLGGHHR